MKNSSFMNLKKKDIFVSYYTRFLFIGYKRCIKKCNYSSYTLWLLVTLLPKAIILRYKSNCLDWF